MVVKYKKLGREITDREEWESAKIGAGVLSFLAFGLLFLFSFAGIVSENMDMIKAGFSLSLIFISMALALLGVVYSVSSEERYEKITLKDNKARSKK